MKYNFFKINILKMSINEKMTHFHGGEDLNTTLETVLTFGTLPDFSNDPHVMNKANSLRGNCDNQ